jgi:hypothetical protein
MTARTSRSLPLTPHAVLTDPPSADTLSFESVPAPDDGVLDTVLSRLGPHPFDLRDGPLYRFCLVRSQARAVLDGKVTRLGGVPAAPSEITAPPAAPGYQDDLEREIAELWMELLDLPAIDPGRSLLECGAHSLLVFSALSRVRRRYNVAALAAAIRRGRAS